MKHVCTITIESEDNDDQVKMSLALDETFNETIAAHRVAAQIYEMVREGADAIQSERFFDINGIEVNTTTKQ